MMMSPNEAIHNRVTEYMTQQVKQMFPRDYELVADKMNELVSRYSLKEVIQITREEIKKANREKSEKRDLQKREANSSVSMTNIPMSTISVDGDSNGSPAA
jgi:hypothetical protein